MKTARTVFALVTVLLCAMSLLRAATHVTVPGTADPFLAGLPDGSTAKGGDKAPAQSPVLVPLTGVNGGDQITFSATGSTSVSGPPSDTGTLDGDSFFYSGPENGISGCNYPINALVGVFLDNNPPLPPRRRPIWILQIKPAFREERITRN